MPKRPVALALALTLLAGCAASRVPATSFAEPSDVERAVMRYYERHASEENRTCLTPYIDGINKVTVVEETPERLVIDVRYLYGDRFKDDRDTGMGRECVGYRERQFTLGKGTAGVRGARDDRADLSGLLISTRRGHRLPGPAQLCMMTPVGGGQRRGGPRRRRPSSRGTWHPEATEDA